MAELRKNPRVQLLQPGLMPYQQAWDWQEQLFQSIIAQKVANRELPTEEQVPTANYLILLQHPPVYTLGKSGDMAHLLVSEETLRAEGVDFFRINRGGDITFHGPGQLVGYPILDLDNFFTDIHKYLRFIEEAIIRTLADYGITAGRQEGYTGVWIDNRKICAIGVRTSRWVSMHGFAFNIHPDLGYFRQIVPCGISEEGKEVTSLAAELGYVPDFEQVSQRVIFHLADLFGMEFFTES